MNKHQEFEELKEQMLQAYAEYTERIKKTSFDDLRQIPVRIELMDMHTKAMLVSISYRTFVIKHQPPTEYELKRKTR